MKTITTREIQQNTRAVRERLESGESLEWTIRGRIVAHLTPAIRHVNSVDWGDPFQRSLAAYDSETAHNGISTAEQIYQDRG